ncbi:hypothetical protein FPOAC1_004165 [Fusarium poae]|uniref:hypothetical protein n=1 Tax=Fusarium poae TaxID=36050 RepID=UPI001CEA6BB6|nr:hypothetical protein FPOAC1_004165 [Fusarium poae]KAG8670930.1 hypothetical protein FPOAC1_004165 [Fusarium poae]
MRKEMFTDYPSGTCPRMRTKSQTNTPDVSQPQMRTTPDASHPRCEAILRFEPTPDVNQVYQINKTPDAVGVETITVSHPFTALRPEERRAGQYSIVNPETRVRTN